MKITILCVGKIKEKFYRDAVAEYEKRLSRYCRFEVTEVADEKTPDHASENMELLIKEKEAERMEKYLKEGTHVIAVAAFARADIPAVGQRVAERQGIAVLQIVAGHG